jgi:uncharacterized alpha/beta hydrolase family protein
MKHSNNTILVGKLIIQLIAILCIVFILLLHIINTEVKKAIKSEMASQLADYFDKNAPTIYEETSNETQK